MTHLAPVPGTDWQVWRWALLRSAGFPIDGLRDLAAPGCAATADEHLAGRADAAAFDRAFDAAVRRWPRHYTNRPCRPRMPAMLWQNPDAAVTIAGVLRDGPDAARKKHHGRREELVARYWQRSAARTTASASSARCAGCASNPGAPFVRGGPPALDPAPGRPV